ncbi:hypothetical protein M413DRAFT_447772 [Hebeloma cylindrosporum]|uniref:Alpha/beta hydrolase fold-3 domain-containing protein n=1 Tax=Hebeloma cylindrosporum TaxID=76867 RepID=A0A0C3BPE6_HEBCY|nr:hypothetical protein M413DRAFT_447772 [Hebeloma cylindrosporum h7]
MSPQKSPKLYTYRSKTIFHVQPRTKELIDPTHPLLEAKRDEIESIDRKTFQYGLTERHQLDVYYPSEQLPQNSNESHERGKPPILAFLYGGGLVQGNRSNSPSHLVHNNLGAFFASRGVLTVIPDYRLVPGITYPQGSEDVRDALTWILTNLISEGDTCQIYILAHSAGGMHLNGLLLNPVLYSPLAHAIRGVALMGSPCAVTTDMHKLYQVALGYYGSAKAIAREEPISLLRRVSAEYVTKLPPLRMLVAGSEPARISNSMRGFAEEFQAKGGIVDELILEGHDHLSPVLALSTGTGEEWGYEIVRWIHEGGS